MRFIILLILAVSFPVCYAQYGGLEYIKVSAGTINNVDTVIEANIENWGTKKVFVALPEGWKIYELATLKQTSYPVRIYVTRYWELFGLPHEETSPIGRGEVFDFKTEQTKGYTEVAGRQGWYLRPNEAISIGITVKDISTSGGMIDPIKIEKENTCIRIAIR